MASPASHNKFRYEVHRGGDSRKTVRFYLEAAASCVWQDALGRPMETKGRTRDVSQRGAYILAPDCPPNGTSVRVAILLPPLAGEARPLRIEAEGTVLRSERARQGLVGFVVANHRLLLCSL